MSAPRFGKDTRAATIRLKERAGGRCVICGYDKNYAALDFHHIFPIEKSCGVKASSEKGVAEADKCVLLCRNCHADHHHPRYRKNEADRNKPTLVDELRAIMDVSPPPYKPPTARELLSTEQYEQMLDHCDPERIEARRLAMYQNFI